MELKIRLTEKFLSKGDSESKIKTYYQLDDEEERVLWKFLNDLLDYTILEGKNKPSNIKDKYVDGLLVVKKINTNNGLLFLNKNLWHYHIASVDYPYGDKQYYHKPTNPILHQNLRGRTTSLLIHYSKREIEDYVEVGIWGISHHNCWNDLYKTIN
jgi:hypothetical protein